MQVERVRHSEEATDRYRHFFLLQTRTTVEDELKRIVTRTTNTEIRHQSYQLKRIVTGTTKAEIMYQSYQHNVYLNPDNIKRLN